MLKVSYIYYLILTLCVACSKKEQPNKVTFDSKGLETKECSISAADGHGPYLSLGRKNERECYRMISNKCNSKKFKQVHKRKGHFARGKFGSKIMIGLCD